MMKKIAGTPCLLLLIWSLAGCQAVGQKSASLTVVYAAAAVLALLLLIGYCCAVREKLVWFVLMFSGILVVNIGYFALATSATLSQALWANRVAYLGSVLLPLSMLMIILNVTNTAYKKWLPRTLMVLSALVLFVAASPGYLDVYYKEVSLEIANGVARLVKVYGPLHPVYLVYLLAYFGAMVGVIIRARIKKSIDTTAHAVVIAIAVFVNLGVWFIEQLVSIEFEFLSISYIISELFLLGVHLMMNETQRLKDRIQQQSLREPVAEPVVDEPVVVETVVPDAAELFLEGMTNLTPKERLVFDAYVAGTPTKEILEVLNIKENTLKYHSKNLYAKLGVTSRKQLTAMYKQLAAAGAIDS